MAVVASLVVPAALILVMIAAEFDAFEVVSQALLLYSTVPIIFLALYMWATGKGAMFIAGYNTSPKAVRDMYDAPALARFVGKLVVVSVIIMLLAMESLFLLDDFLLFIILLIASFVILMGAIVYMNTGKRFIKKDAAPPVITEKDRRRTRLIALGALVAVVATILVVFAFADTGDVSATLDEEGLHVEAPFVNKDIPLDEISSVELRDDFDVGRRVGGFGGTRVQSGQFLNDELGRYTLAAYTFVPLHIVVHHSDGVLVLNVDTVEGTQQLYDALQQGR